MSASLLSPFERLLVHIKHPISAYIRSCHPTYSPVFPATHLLSFLSLPSKLSLRLVSSTTKGWVNSADPSVFSNLSVLFPLNTFSTEDLLALYNTSSQCEHLTLTVSQFDPVLRPSDVIPLPPFPRLQHLSLTAPDHDPFQGLLSFRLAFQRANIPLLTQLTITNLSFPGILALRWGSFTSFDDASWTSRNVWHGLKELDVKVVGWWQDKVQPKEHHSHYDPDAEKEDWRTYTRVLHDWLHSFATNGQLDSFRFEWVNGEEGPNPFTLDEFVSIDGKKEWFSAPAIRWTGLRVLWLGNIVVSDADVRRMKERMAGLEKLVVRLECLDYGLGGVKVVADGKMWVEIDVKGQRLGEWSEVVRKRELSAAAATRGSYRESSTVEDRASMVLPFMLDLSPEDGHFL